MPQTAVQRNKKMSRKQICSQIMRFAMKYAKHKLPTPLPPAPMLGKSPGSLSTLMMHVNNSIVNVNQIIAVNHVDGRYPLLSKAQCADFRKQTDKLLTAIVDLNKEAHKLTRSKAPNTLEHDQKVNALARVIYRELCGILREDPTFEVDVREKTVSVVSEPIVLRDPENNEDHNLGRFRIVIKIGVNNQIPYVVPLEPNQSNITARGAQHPHPHVGANGVPCYGEGGAAVKKAVDDGRFGDAFDVCNGVLRSYLASESYTRLSSWRRPSCRFCGDRVEPAGFRRCVECASDGCEDCMVLCEECDSHTCTSHARTCGACGGTGCMRCFTTCFECDTESCGDCIHSCVMCSNSLCTNCSKPATGGVMCEGCFEEWKTSYPDAYARFMESRNEPFPAPQPSDGEMPLFEIATEVSEAVLSSVDTVVTDDMGVEDEEAWDQAVNPPHAGFADRPAVDMVDMPAPVIDAPSPGTPFRYSDERDWDDDWEDEEYDETDDPFDEDEDDGEVEEIDDDDEIDDGTDLEDDEYEDEDDYEDDEDE